MFSRPFVIIGLIMKYRISYLILLLLLLVCCRSYTSEHFVSITDSTNYIDLSDISSSDTLKLSDIVDDIQVIRLETSESSLISSIRQIVFSDDKFIYVNDRYQGGGVLIFDYNGRFIRRLPSGNGPGDVHTVLSISFDKKRRQLLVNMPACVKIFSEEGQFLKAVEINFSTLHLVPYGGGYLFSQLPSMYNSNMYYVITADSAFVPNGCLYFPKKYLGYAPYNMFYPNIDGSVDIVQPHNNMVMSYRDTTLSVKTVLDLGKNYFDATDILDYESFDGQFDESLYVFRGIYSEAERYQYFQLEKGDHTFVSVYYNKTSHQKRCGRIIPLNLEEHLLRSQFAGSFNGYFVRYFSWDFYAQDFDRSNLLDNYGDLPQDVVEKVKNLKDDDNPLIILYKLKDIPADTIPE